jgi:hypothetical protein
MSAASTYLQNAILNHLLRGEDLPSLGTVYAALHIEDPTEEGLEATEVDADGYARVSLGVQFSDAVAGIALNAEAIEFPEAGADWGTVKYLALWDSATDGNMLVAGPLGTYRTVGAGDICRFDAGAFEIRVR